MVNLGYARQKPRSRSEAEGPCFDRGTIHAAPTGLLVNQSFLATEYFAPNGAVGSLRPSPFVLRPSSPVPT